MCRLLFLRYNELMSIFLVCLLIAVAFNLMMFAIAFSNKSDKITDLSYCATFIVIAFAAYLRQPPFSPIKTVVLVLVTLWAVRLASYLVVRVHKIKRDKRFDGIREDSVKFGSFWLFQAMSAWLIMVPCIAILSRVDSGERLPASTGIGLTVWLIGFVFEAVADRQKFAFINKKSNQGKWINTGLWRLSRHPNYLGEITMWIGLYLCIGSYLTPQMRLISLVSPLWIAFLLLFVSGIPKLEKSADERWGKDKDYKQYKRDTPLLIPFIKR